MAKAQPPDWGPDSLSSKYFKDAEYNDRATAANFPEVFELLKQVHACFEKIEEITSNDSGATRILSRFLLVRAHSTFLAACRLAMSGQIGEAQVLNRAAIEQAWYALHIAKDPASWTRAEIWLRRNESADAKASCKAEFTVAKVRATHASRDAGNAQDLGELYDLTIDFGAHPNQMGVLSSIRRVEDAANVVYNVGILAPNTLGVMVAIRVTVAIAVGVFRVFRVIYPERFAIMVLDDEIAALGAALNTVFQRFVTSGTA